MQRFLIFCLSLFLLVGCLSQTSDTASGVVDTSTGTAQTAVESGASSSGGFLSSMTALFGWQSKASTGTIDSTEPSAEERALLRRKLRSLIQRADYYALRGERELALEQFVRLDRRTAGDPAILKKAARLAYEMRLYDRSKEFWTRIDYGSLSVEDKTQFLTSILWSAGTNEEKRMLLGNTPIDPVTRPYWEGMLLCQETITPCVEGILTYTGSEWRMRELSTLARGAAELTDDYQYRRMLLAGELVKQKQWNAALFIAKEVLSARPDYLSALKVAGLSSYELSLSSEAQKYLESAYKIDSNAADSAYLLGLVAMDLGDLEVANLHLNKAVSNGYRPKTDLERRLAYNYFLLWDAQSMVKIFHYLLDEVDVTEDDYTVAVYLAMENGDIPQAKRWCDRGLIKFPRSDNLLSLSWKMALMENDLSRSRSTLLAAIDINARNPTALLSLWVTEKLAGNYTEAQDYLSRAQKADTTWALQADIEREMYAVSVMREAYSESHSGANTFISTWAEYTSSWSWVTTTNP